jgi:hypothetical protein
MTDAFGIFQRLSFLFFSFFFFVFGTFDVHFSHLSHLFLLNEMIPLIFRPCEEHRPMIDLAGLFCLADLREGLFNLANLQVAIIL